MELIKSFLKFIWACLTYKITINVYTQPKKVAVFIGTFYSSDNSPWNNFLTHIFKIKHGMTIKQYMLAPSSKTDVADMNQELSAWGARIRYREVDEKYKDYELPNEPGIFLEFDSQEDYLEFVLYWS